MDIERCRRSCLIVISSRLARLFSPCWDALPLVLSDTLDHGRASRTRFSYHDTRGLLWFTNESSLAETYDDSWMRIFVPRVSRGGTSGWLSEYRSLSSSGTCARLNTGRRKDCPGGCHMPGTVSALRVSPSAWGFLSLLASSGRGSLSRTTEASWSTIRRGLVAIAGSTSGRTLGKWTETPREVAISSTLVLERSSTVRLFLVTTSLSVQTRC